MYHFFVSPHQIEEKQIRIEGADVNHIRNVLRMMPKEQISISSREDTKEYHCEIAQIEENYVLADILWVGESDTELPSKICLFQGLPKSDKMEWIIQKCVELGVAEIVPVQMGRSVVKLDAKKAQSKGKRWNLIAESAAKQSKRSIIPEVKEVMTYQEALSYADTFDKVFVPYECAEGMKKTRTLISEIKQGESVAFFIGPEGGFEESEILKAAEHGIVPLTLGKRILRTETAAITMLSILMFHLERY